MVKIEDRTPFAELGERMKDTKAYRDYMEQEFYVQDPVHPDHEKIITRSDFEDTMASMQCWPLSDAAMKRIADMVSEALTTYPEANITDENDLDDALCREQEDALRAFGVPYYEDEIEEPPVGSRIFSVDDGYGTYLGMGTDDCGEPAARIRLDNGEETTAYLGLIIAEY